MSKDASDEFQGSTHPVDSAAYANLTFSRWVDPGQLSLWYGCLWLGPAPEHSFRELSPRKKHDSPDPLLFYGCALPTFQP